MVHTGYALQSEQDADTFSLQLGLEKAFSSRLYARAFISGARNNAVAAAYAHWSLGTGLTLSRQMGRMTAYAGVSYSQLESDAPFFAFGAIRQDRSVELSAGLALCQIHIAGLAPIIRFSHTDNSSNLTLYDFRRNRIELGLTRDF